MISAIVEGITLFVTRPYAFIRDVVVAAFYWSTRIFGVVAAIYQTVIGKGN